ncbi:MAG: 50S ribosomal protein L24 [Candidatus Omnitrophota bacterium]|jgi:large subunit ribosomal protein L24|nr:MAG: 50S ribosomal protein L24 [Candidatus Omnitrophota bacterium]
MFKLKKGDTVILTKGKDKGKKGKVLKIFGETKRAIVEGVNLVKKHKRKTQQDQQGGVVAIEAPISIANISILCKQCNKAVRIGYTLLKDGTKTRTCKSCKEAI